MARDVRVFMISGGKQLNHNSRSKERKTERCQSDKRKCPGRKIAGASAPGLNRQDSGVYPCARTLMRYSANATINAPIIMDKSGSSRP